MVSKEVEQLLNQAQIYQQQIQAVLTQKEAFKLEINEIKRALEELEKTKEKTAYKISGPILIKNDIGSIKKDLKEKLDFLNLKVKNIERQEMMLKKKVEGLKDRLSEIKTSDAG